MPIRQPNPRMTTVVVALAAALLVAGIVVAILVAFWAASSGQARRAHAAPDRAPTASPSPTATGVPTQPPTASRDAGPLTVRVVTANVPFTLTEAAAREQFRHVLLPGADVVVMNEVKHRRVGSDVARLQPGRWNVFQPRGEKGETAVLWRTDRFGVRRHGVRLGSPSRYGDARYLPWVVLHDRRTGLDVTVVGVHFPTNASKYAGMRARYLAMNGGLTGLVDALHRLGHPIIAGGDWNHPLRTTREPWSPVPTMRAVGLTTNWRLGLPCRGTSAFLGQIDGFALSPGLRLTRQGCLSRLHSDHRPVWMDVDLTPTPVR